jgi:hypothetical protein
MDRPIAPTASARRIASLRRKLLGLARACPLAADNPPDCPLHNLRRQPARQIERWLGGLTAAEAQFLLRYHECCLAVQLERRVLPAVRSQSRARRPAGRR